MGGDGAIFPLLVARGGRTSGVFLKELPGIIHAVEWGNQWGRVVGQVGESFQGSVVGGKQFTLDVQVRGRDCRQTVSGLIDAISDGVFTLVANSPGWGAWGMQARVDSVSEPKWVGVESAYMCELSIMATAFRPRWGRDPVVRVDSAESILAQGGVRGTTVGTEPFWPKFTITGGFSSVSIRLGDGVQEIPFDSRGWVVDADPMSRVVQPIGGTEFMGFVPHWDTPVTVTSGGFFIPVVVSGAGSDFIFKTEFTPEVKRGW